MSQRAGPLLSDGMTLQEDSALPVGKVTAPAGILDVRGSELEGSG